MEFLKWAIPSDNPRFEVYKALFDYGSGIQEIQKFCTSKSNSYQRVAKKFAKTILYKKEKALALSKSKMLLWKKKYLGDGVVTAFYSYFKKFSKNQKKSFDLLIQNVNHFFVHGVLLGNKKRSFCDCRMMTLFFKKQGEKNSGVSSNTVRQFRKALKEAQQQC
jgi:hypothetical protein